jgi:hypothetical protein
MSKKQEEAYLLLFESVVRKGPARASRSKTPNGLPNVPNSRKNLPPTPQIQNFTHLILISRQGF